MSSEEYFQDWRKRQAVSFTPQDGGDQFTISELLQRRAALASDVPDTLLEDLLTYLYQRGVVQADFFEAMAGEKLTTTTLHEDKPDVQEILALLENAGDDGLPYLALREQFPVVRVMLDRGSLTVTKHLNVTL